jgi:hypothetical protein
MNQKLFSVLPFIKYFGISLAATFTAYHFSMTLVATFFVLTLLSAILNLLLDAYFLSFEPEIANYTLPIFVIVTIFIFHLSFIFMIELFEKYQIRSFIPTGSEASIHLMLAGFFTAVICITPYAHIQFPSSINNNKS